MTHEMNGGRIRGAIGSVLVALIVAAVVLGGPGESVHARRYGGGGYNYAARIARCKGRCSGTASVIRICGGKDRKAATKNCKTVFAENKAICLGDASCKASAKQALTQCIASAKGTTKDELRDVGPASRACGRCCQRSRGQTACGFAFRKNVWYGSYKRYGRNHCVRAPQGSPSAAFLDLSGRIRHGLARLVPWAVDGWAD